MRSHCASDVGSQAGGDSALSCTPGPVDLASLSRHPTPAHTCSPPQLSTLVNACFGSSTTSCGAAQSEAGEATCVDCIYTQATSTAWGPVLLVSPPGATNLLVPTPNLGGCIAAADPSPSAQKCALDLEELQQCDVEACVSRCKVDGVSDVAGRQALFGAPNMATISGGCFGSS